MPRTPDEFPGPSYEEGTFYSDDGYGVPGTRGEVRFSNNRFWMRDGYMAFDVRTYVEPHISSHLGDGSDAFYTVSAVAPTINEDINDGYEVGFRWINTTDGYEYVLIDNSPGAADWRNTTLAGAGGDGITEEEHEVLDTITHDLVENSYDEATYAGNKITNLTTYTDAGKTTKIREEQVSYDIFGRATQAITIQYDSGGSESYRITENITYQLGRIKSITRTRS